MLVLRVALSYTQRTFCWLCSNKDIKKLPAIWSCSKRANWVSFKNLLLASEQSSNWERNTSTEGEMAEN